jgi:hypothetical protein
LPYSFYLSLFLSLYLSLSLSQLTCIVCVYDGGIGQAWNKNSLFSFPLDVGLFLCKCVCECVCYNKHFLWLSKKKECVCESEPMCVSMCWMKVCVCVRVRVRVWYFFSVDQKGGYKNSRVVEQTFAKRGKNFLDRKCVLDFE